MIDQPTPLPADDASRILLVDDDATNLDVLRQTLAGSSYRLFVARNGEDALKVAHRAHPLMILLDVVMPGIDGYETCRRLKQDPETRDAAVVFLSALADPKDKVRGFEAGAVDFITKPFQSDEVVARVNTHLTIQRMLRRQAESGAPAKSHARSDDELTSHPAVEDRRPGDPVFRTGDVVAFRFRIVRYLAKGGMGELYEAEDLELRERVALKTILSTIAEDERSILLFKREVHLARQVTHPNVCRIYDVFRHRPGAGSTEGVAHEVVFLAMELLHGETIAEKLRRDGRFPTTQILPIVRQMASGLAAAHRVGVVHRDFKSHNVMLVKPTSPEDEMRVVVTDFGLARRSVHATSTELSLSLTEADGISGTPAYMAPEQVEGGPVTPATDVYALGVVLFELVTGVCPFVADTPLGTAIKRLQEPPPTPRVHVPDVDARWEATILKCLARHAADRFASVTDVVAALEGTRTERSVAAQGGHHRRRGAWVMMAVILSAALAGAYVVYGRYVAGSTPAGITSLAVLPFRNTSGDPGQDYLFDGISEGLTNRLAQLPGVKVVANNSSAKYKGKDVDLQEVARTLNVIGILAGRVVQRGDLLTINVELIDGRDRTQVWGEQYLRKAGDLLQVQAEISRDVAEKLQVRVSPGGQQRLATHEARNPEAYELLLRGHFHRARGGTEDRKKAAEYFTRAIAVDPAYALAYADLSDIYRSLINSGLLDPIAFLPKARAAANKALELDDGLADAHYTLANLMTYAWEWADAEREYKRAIELNPNHALAHRWYAAYLRLIGRHDQAVAEITRARELDPLSPGVNATVGYVLSSARRYDEALDALNRTIELDRTYPYAHLFLGHTYAAQRKYVDAVAAYQQAITLGLDTPATQVFLGAAYAQAGDRRRALAVLRKLRVSTEHVSKGELAILLTALGEREQAFASLDEAYRARDIQLQYLGVDPGFDPLRSDPRFQDLVQRVGLAR